MFITTREYKAAGTALFAAGDFNGAVQQFTKAINNPVGKKNAILFSNRAACYYALGQYEEGLVDSIKATELDPLNAKAWIRRGACEEGMMLHGESIRSYERAITCTSIPSLLRRCEERLKSAKDNTPHVC
ncbi:hypothetical protein B0H13DRAFT_2682529 [Mycena leptocephala]|nr:hypothetical protein B0H13DRAFT_2682529 [Mycena leptocephala]